MVNKKNTKVYQRLGKLLLASSLSLPLFSGLALTAPVNRAYAAEDTTNKTRFLTLYNQIKDPANGYFSPEGIPYHAVETLLSEAPDHGHMTTSETYSYWLWLEALYGHHTGNWTRLEQAWDNMEKYIIPNASEQPTMGGYNPSSPATYAPEHPQPDQYPSQLGSSVTAGKDPLDAELKSTYGNNQTYLMHWLVDADNWYGFGNPLNPSHTANYINTFQRGEQESVWEAIPHPSQETFQFGKPGEGFATLFVKDNSAPAKQWRYTDATDADARVVQVMYWAKSLGYNNTVYLEKAKKLGDYLRYGMYDKYFQQIGSAADGTPAPGSGKDSAHYLMAWYTAWGGGIGSNWAWRIGASHNHQAYQNPMAAYALSEGGLAPKSPTAKQDWETSLKRQLEFYTWLLSSEGGIGGGATNSKGGTYAPYPAGVSTFYGMAYEDAPVYHDPPSNTWFGFQAWPVERIAEYYYSMAAKGDTASENFKMAKRVMDQWVKWALSYTFVDKKPVTDSDGYFLNSSGQKILGGANPQVATTPDPGQFYILGGQEWTGQPDTWKGFGSFTGNPNYHVIAKGTSQDTGVLGSYIKLLTFYAAGAQAENNGTLTAAGSQAKTTAEQLLNVAWNHNDGIGIAVPEKRGDYSRYFTKEIYFPSGWSGTYGQGNTLPGTGGVPSDPAKGGDGVYLSYTDLRPKIKQDPKWSYLENLYKSSYDQAAKKWTKGEPTFTYHRFWAQVDMATAYAEYSRLFGSGTTTPSVPGAPAGLAAAAGDAKATLTWSASAGAASYNVKRATTAGGPYTTVATGVTGTSFTNTGLTNGTTYYYVVSAVNAVGESPNSAQVSAKPQAGTPAVPAAPAGLTAAAGDAKVTLGWSASAGAASYTVKRATTAGGPYTALATGVTATGYTDTAVTNGTTYYYVVSAVNAAGESANSAQVSAKPQAPASTGAVSLQYRAADTNPVDNQFKPHFNLVNKGTSAVPLSSLTIRYWYTADSDQALNFNVDYAVVGSSNVTGKFVKLAAARTGADSYLEVGFGTGAGSIAAGGSSGEIQTRINRANWSNLNESNDYSFDPTKTAFTDWNKVTVYKDGVLIWGVEP
ncbi:MULTISPECIES: glycoside hydrolase family 48 protein [Paenibacillus]|uniref:glycoside hydrolase family 48 protein n=1 Tax=Paenibacillus TaxID=44249 RepID=UPI0022B85E90|nr:glycoside hydrolase family 48 protein [Paenibacillus caseinilyticus]MCZ8518502.1 cellulose 1,4-beta-cellobiosidase [Paenibacillus caseinilyticus]